MVHIIKIILVLLLTLTFVWALQNRKPHDFDNKCYDCHVGMRDPTVLTRNADYLCLTCHPEQTRVSHPTGIVPKRKIPPSFPLYNGKIQCITCHLAHKTYDENDIKGKGNDSNPYLLRYSTAGKVFCFRCHFGGPDDFTVSTTDAHALGFERAHESHKRSLKGIIDDDSRECLSCHDGTISRDANVTVAGATWEHARGIGVSHPIGVEYDKAYFRNPRMFHRASSLDRRIKLLNGKIGCQTCHNHFSKNPHLLVMDNTRSRLCLQCHDL